ncbi:HIT family protein [Jeongeupia naejangsanensis]|uniref:Uncharacterized protein n=1 Tax=Jeongeupia naejangsanensis TaxID=613195 RepID=A0ABS2BJF9_9NEIS|nr:hypothetical protein [Jeongeupia naejangsanensis]MBM3115736.1 hypothetical protein [Jeongeupia naejangsanensis]
MYRYLIFETDHWLVSHRRDARHPGYLIVACRESKGELHELSIDALQELGLVLQKTEKLLRSFFAPCKVIFYKLGFSSGFSCHFHAAPVTQKLLSEIVAHCDYTNEPDGNDAILFLSRVYCERPLTEAESLTLNDVVNQLRKAANTSFNRDGLTPVP